MKIVCLDADNCGFYKKLEPEDDLQVLENTCPICFGEALLYTDNHTPILYEQGENKTKKINNLLATVHNLFTDYIKSKNNADK